MGLIRSFTGSVSSTMADQWKEYFYCESLPADIIVKKGEMRTAGSNHASDNVISTGTVIAVNEGQAMAVVKDGKIMDFSSEPGAYVFDSSGEPTIFHGPLDKGIYNSFETFKRRLSYGSDTGVNFRIYYFNTKELPGNKFGTPEALLYDDPIYQTIRIRLFGTVSLRIVDPIKFYVNVSGNVADDYKISNYWEDQLKAEFLTNLMQAVSMLSTERIKFSLIPQSQVKLVHYMNMALDKEWSQERGIVVTNTSIPSISLDPDDQARVNKIDEMRLMKDMGNAAGRLASAQANAMEAAANNEKAGAMNAFLGMDMARLAGGMNLPATKTDGFSPLNPSNPDSPATWVCACGNMAQGNFCSRCGAKRPPAGEWICSCGNIAKGNFCSVCGKKRLDN